MIIKGKINGVFNMFLKKKTVSLDGYTLIKDLTPSYTSRINRVGIYKNKKDLVVIKRAVYNLKDLDAVYNENEAKLLKILSKIKTSKKLFPEFIEHIAQPHLSALITKFSSGSLLESYDKNIQWKIAKKASQDLQELSQDLSNQHLLQSLSVRKPFSYLLSFPVSCFKQLMRAPFQFVWYIYLGIQFYRWYVPVMWEKITLGIVHRDLFPDNILYDERTNAITITDWESALVSDPLYDIAQVAMIYSNNATIEDLTTYINTFTASSGDKKRFLALSIFTSIQMLSNTPKNHEVYKNIHVFLKRLQKEVQPRLFYKKSLFELLFSNALTFLYYFYKVTRLSLYSTSKKLILCYHSIGKNGWRYSMDPEKFAAQIDFLVKHYTITSLSALMKENNGGVSITFDDSYKDVLENALPLLSARKIHATMFALGDSSHANRRELDNNLEFLTTNDLLLLKKNGWVIGSHTMTHGNLKNLSTEALEEEIVQSKQALEKIVGSPVMYLAYPKGIYSRQIMDIAQKAGYTFAFTTDGYESSQQNTTPFGVSRILLEYSLTQKQFEALLSPLGLMLSRISVPVLQLKEMLSISVHKLFRSLLSTGKSTITHVLPLILLFILIAVILGGFVKGKNENGKLLYQHDYNRGVGGPLEASNSTARYALTESLVKNGSVFLSENLAQFASPDIVYYNNKYLSIFTPGVSFIGVPFYFVGNIFGIPQLATFIAVLLFALFDVFLIAKISKKIGVSSGFGFVGGLIFLFATNALAYSLTFTQHIMTVSILLSAIYCVLSTKNIRNSILFGILCGIGILLDIPNIFLFLPIVLCFLVLHLKKEETESRLSIRLNWRFLAILVGIIPFVLIFGWYNIATTGSPTKLGQTLGRSTAFQTQLPEQVASNAATFQDDAPRPIGISHLPFSTRAQLDGMYTLLLSDERSWLFYCPVIFVGLVGLIVLYRKKETRFFSLMCFAIVGIDILLYAMFTDPWGGWAFGPRYLIPGAGVLSLGIGAALERYKKNVIALLVFFALFLYSAWVNVLGALTTSSIPPKVEAIHLNVPIPWNYQYNLQLLHTNFSSSLFYNLVAEKKLDASSYLFLMFFIITILVVGVFFLTTFRRKESK